METQQKNLSSHCGSGCSLGCVAPPLLVTAPSELLCTLCFQTRDSVAPKLKQWVQLVVSSCGDHLPTESRLAAAKVLTSATPLFLTNPRPLLGKCGAGGGGGGGASIAPNVLEVPVDAPG